MAPVPDLEANHEGRPKRSDDYLSLPVLVRQARKVVEAQDLPISGSRLRKLVRRWIDSGRTDLDFYTWFISYADPVGEEAVNRVLKQKRGAIA